jgi:enoyl-CoA hydratase
MAAATVGKAPPGVAVRHTIEASGANELARCLARGRLTMSEVLLCEIRDQVAVVTLCRPNRRNALSGALLTDLRAALVEANASPEVKTIVLTGADPAFCAGLDLTELGQPAGPLAAATSGTVVPELTKPLIGAINGVAITGGLELALACDFLIASERARFADTHARIGIQPGWGLTVALPEAVGLRRAREMSATGNFVSARTALDWGLVNHVVPHEDLLPFTLGLAADVASSDAAAVTRIYATYREVSQVPGSEAMSIEARAHRGWHTAGIDGDQVARRREAVIERGRSQAGSRS